MPVTVPTSDQLKEIANQVGLSLTEADVASFIGLMTPSIAGYNVVDALPDNLPQVKYPRTPGYRPSGPGHEERELSRPCQRRCHRSATLRPSHSVYRRSGHSHSGAGFGG